MDRTWMPVVGGILSIIAGAIGLLGGLIIGMVASIYLSTSYYGGPGNHFTQTAIVWAVFLPYLLFCAVAIAGGIYALKRRLWGLALAGAICAFFTIWAWPLSIAAIVFVSLSREEFNHRHLPPPPAPESPLLPP